MKPNNDGGTFIRITNKDIYEEIQGIKNLLHNMNFKINEIDKVNVEEHNVLKSKILLNKWIATTALSLIIIIVTILIKHGG